MMTEPTLGNRLNFVDIINKKQYKIAVEIGVRYGWFSKYLLDNSCLEHLSAIDPWNFNEENNDPTGSYNIAKRNFHEYGDRVKMIVAKNEDVVHLFPINQIDFVYLDGLHDYLSVKKDLENWYGRLKNGGCMAGHDYNKNQWSGLCRAVDEFVEKYNVKLLFTGVGDMYGETDFGNISWYFFKDAQ